MEEIKIYKTKDYDQFKTIKGNRKISNVSIADLTKAIFRKNLLAHYPILINSQFEIIDGQRRLTVAKLNDLDIYYTQVQDANIDDVIDINSSSREWRIQNYIDSFVVNGNKNYIWIDQFAKNNNLNYTYALILIYGKEIRSSKILRSGMFKVSEMEKQIAEERLDLYTTVRSYLSTQKRVSRGFVDAIAQIHQEGLHEALLKKISQLKKPLVLEHYYEDILKQLKDIIKS